MENTQIVIFLLASLAVILTPGQDLVLVLSRGIAHGIKAGIVTAAGVSIGLMGHTLLAAFGVGALLTTSELFFSIVKYVGAAYLMYLGVKMLLSKRSDLALEETHSKSLKKAFITGALSNISNPKITIFYLAFLPQFISVNTQNPTLLLFILGSTFALLTFIVKVPFGYFAGRSSQWLRSRPKVIHWMDRVSGSVLIALGLRLAFDSGDFDK
ncbi:MAG: LysE family translocator [Leucothrix sp.]